MVSVSTLKGHQIYLATPYSHDDPTVREARFKEACRIAGNLISQGINCFSPIAHSHPIAVNSRMALGFDMWESLDLCVLGKSDDLVVATMEGWQTSKGVGIETRYSATLGKPIWFLDPEDPDLIWLVPRQWHNESKLV